jgi:hypothetical protein
VFTAKSRKAAARVTEDNESATSNSFAREPRIVFAVELLPAPVIPTTTITRRSGSIASRALR